MTIARHDFKYGDTDWKLDVGESFQITKKTTTKYTVVDGEIVSTEAIVLEWDDPLAGIPVPLTGPPYLYADKTYRADTSFQFIETHDITSVYQVSGPDSYTVQISDFNVLTGETTNRTVQINTGLPLAPTIGSKLSRLTLQPIVTTLYDPCDFVSSKSGYVVEFAEDTEDLDAVARRKMQRATAIVRKVKLAANPQIHIGDTVRLICSQRAIDGNHLVVGRTITIEQEGGANMTLDLEFWTR